MLRFAITPGELRNVDAPEAAELVRQCARLAADGVDFLLLREKSLSPEDLEILGCRVLEQVQERDTKVILPGLAERPLFGRHLTLNELPAEGWTSVSCHTVREVRLARSRGPSAVLFAPVFGKTVNGTLVTPGVGLEALREACVAAAGMTVFALGGVTSENAPDCIAAGAGGVAGIRMFFR